MAIRAAAPHLAKTGGCVVSVSSIDAQNPVPGASVYCATKAGLDALTRSLAREPVGFAIGQDDTHFYVLDGNQSDAVTIARIVKSRLLGARWPATYPPRLQRLPTMKPGDFLSTTNET